MYVSSLQIFLKYDSIAFILFNLSTPHNHRQVAGTCAIHWNDLCGHGQRSQDGEDRHQEASGDRCISTLIILTNFANLFFVAFIPILSLHPYRHIIYI